MPLKYTEHEYDSPETLAAALATAVGADLRGAIARRGTAAVALSGGTTPARFLRELSRQPLDWPRVVVTLCDERWVPPLHERSNERLVRKNLLGGDAAAARFVALYADVAEPEQAAEEIRRRVDAAALPLDVAVLGLGSDGHTASWFPGGDNLAKALDPHGDASVLPMRAPGAGEPRITLTLPVIAAARSLYLHIEGPDKKRAFAGAVGAEGGLASSPLRALMQNAAVPLAVYWCA